MTSPPPTPPHPGTLWAQLLAEDPRSLTTEQVARYMGVTHQRLLEILSAHPIHPLPTAHTTIRFADTLIYSSSESGQPLRLAGELWRQQLEYIAHLRSHTTTTTRVPA